MLGAIKNWFWFVVGSVFRLPEWKLPTPKHNKGLNNNGPARCRGRHHHHRACDEEITEFPISVGKIHLLRKQINHLCMSLKREKKSRQQQILECQSKTRRKEEEEEKRFLARPELKQSPQAWKTLCRNLHLKKHSELLGVKQKVSALERRLEGQLELCHRLTDERDDRIRRLKLEHEETRQMLADERKKNSELEGCLHKMTKRLKSII